MHFASIPFTEMPAELESGAVSAAVLPEPFASDEEEAQGGVPIADLDQRVVDVMQQFLGFPKFDIGSMLMGNG